MLLKKQKQRAQTSSGKTFRCESSVFRAPPFRGAGLNSKDFCSSTRECPEHSLNIRRNSGAKCPKSQISLINDLKSRSKNFPLIALGKLRTHFQIARFVIWSSVQISPLADFSVQSQSGLANCSTLLGGTFGQYSAQKFCFLSSPAMTLVRVVQIQWLFSFFPAHFRENTRLVGSACADSRNGLRVKTQRVKTSETSQKKAIFREDFEDIQKYFKIQ